MTHELIDTQTIDEVMSLLAKHRVKPTGIQHFNPRTIDEAITLLTEYKEARVIAGGTDLLRLMKNEIISPKVLVNVKTIPELKYIAEDAEGLKIGPLTTMKDIEASPVIRDKYSVLAEAAHSVASPNIRNMATLAGDLCQDVQCWYYRRPIITGRSFFCRRKGGEVCYAAVEENALHAIIGGDGCFAVCPSDMAPALMALGAALKIAGPEGERVVPVSEFYTTPGNLLEPNEIITGILVPTPKPGTRQRYLKFRLRKTIDFAISSVAAAITMEAGWVSKARIVLGGVAPVPYRALEAEEAVKGKVITESLARSAAEAAVSKATPLSMNAYKVSITRTLVKRALLE